MSLANALLTILCVACISCGQVLFKVAARSASPSGDFLAATREIALNPFLIGGLVIYLAATALWIWLLRTIPLSVAYPFMALAFLFVPVLAATFLGEPLSFNSALGAVLIVAGIWLIAN
jgi:drug/metabolite transporter (DMT)-like permease